MIIIKKYIMKIKVFKFKIFNNYLIMIYNFHSFYLNDYIIVFASKEI